MQLNGVMNENKLIIAAAGSGKTTFLVNEALKYTSESVLITTYTEANEAEIKKKIFAKKKCMPSNITVQTWFSLLLQHGVRPYQGALNECLFDKEVKGMLLSEGQSGVKYSFIKNGKSINVRYKEDNEFDSFFFTKNWKIYSDKLSKFIYKCNENTRGEVLNRLSRAYSHIFIDEVQDLAGYDLELIKLLFKTKASILLVGDPRQVTYLTHHESKNGKYKDGRIKEFIQNECKRPIKYTIDEKTLNNSHRNNQMICDYSSKLYPEYSQVFACTCNTCRQNITEHEGVFLINEKDVDEYLDKYHPIQLRWDTRVNVNSSFPVINFGESKGQTFDRVIIYPTEEMKKWIQNNSTKLKNATRAKLYVGLTRAKHSVAIIT